MLWRDSNSREDIPNYTNSSRWGHSNHTTATTARGGDIHTTPRPQQLTVGTLTPHHGHNSSRWGHSYHTMATTARCGGTHTTPRPQQLAVVTFIPQHGQKYKQSNGRTVRHNKNWSFTLTCKISRILHHLRLLLRHNINIFSALLCTLLFVRK